MCKASNSDIHQGYFERKYRPEPLPFNDVPNNYEIKAPQFYGRIVPQAYQWS
jgi:hypothetical protein